ncbi:MAG: RNA polymerase sigma factor [Shinella sp.]|jgi:RNA polymerase sigma-70 factor, ECF subfamily|nr:RNA polymerase sigma factor [Shinella sp.]
MTDDAKGRMVSMLPRLRAFALSLTRSRTEADDLVQAACERALHSLHTFREGSNFDAWLFRILRNLWIDGYRRARREVLVDMAEPEHDHAGEDGRHTMEARQTLRATMRAIDDLPEEQRSILILICVDGLSYRDAAEVLDIPIGTVMSRLARARQYLTATVSGNPEMPSGQMPRTGEAQ